jgi:hypothetical protein
MLLVGRMTYKQHYSHSQEIYEESIFSSFKLSRQIGIYKNSCSVIDHCCTLRAKIL